jgi:hypothetical protein
LLSCQKNDEVRRPAAKDARDVVLIKGLQAASFDRPCIL